MRIIRYLNALILFSINSVVAPVLADSESDSFINIRGTYASPGIQFGYTFKKGWFIGAQVTISKDFVEPDRFAGFSNGIRYYSKEIHIYSDIQYGFMTGGGFGGNWVIKNNSLYFSNYRIKMWGGALMLYTIDVSLPKNITDRRLVSVGSMFVLPIPLDSPGKSSSSTFDD